MPRDLRDRLRTRALAHADQHHAVANGHDVTAFHCLHAEIAIGVTPPCIHLAGEARMKAIQGGDQQCFLAARWPIHGVNRDTAVDPGTGVALENQVREGMNNKFRLLKMAAKKAAGAEGLSGLCPATDST